MASGYDKLDFWKAYCRFFYACGDGQGGLRNLASDLAQPLLSDSHQRKRPLDVLCLGIGVAGFEFPLLSSLQAHFDHPIRVVGLDKSANTLNVSAKLCEDLRRNFQSADDFADFIADRWERPHRNPHFVTMDLDGRGKSPLPGKPWTGDDPSDWFKRVNPEVVPDGGFDVVIAAFCFHHVHWWRSTLCNALQMLRPGGLFLLSQVDGDVSLLDWNQQETWLLNERQQEPSGPLERVMSAFWNHPYLRKHMLESGQAGAVRPWPQLDLLDRLPLDRIPDNASHHYFARNTLTPSGLEAIMLTAGLSPFRRAKDHFLANIKDEKQASEAYKAHVRSACSLLEGISQFPTANRIRWHAYRKQDATRFASDPLVRKFQALVDAAGIPAIDQIHSRAIAEFELMEASAVAHDTFHSAVLDNKDFESFVKKLILSGSLSSQTPFGVMGQRLVRQEKFTSSSFCFSNPLGGSASINELMLYMCLRQAESRIESKTGRPYSLKDFSNSNTLLNGILPLFNVPVVFSYVQDDSPGWIGDTSPDQPSIALEIERYRSFLEIRFRIRIPAHCREEILNNRRFQRSLKIVSQSVSDLIAARRTEGLPDFIVSIPEFEEKIRKEFDTQVAQVRQMFRAKPQDLWCVHAKFEESWKKLTALATVAPSGGEDMLNERRLKHLEVVFEEAMIESIYWLCLIPQWRQVVIYPASYSNPEGDGIRADDSLILFYSEHLTNSAIQHEFRKVSIMLDQLNMRRLATSGTSEGLFEQVAAMSHELSKQTTVLFANRLRPISTIFEVGTLPRMTNSRFDWPQPLGKLALEEAIQDEVGSWTVCTNPQLFEALRSYLVLWAGASGVFGFFSEKNGIKTVGDLVKSAITLAQEASVATPLKTREPGTLDDVRDANRSWQRELASLPVVRIEHYDNDPILNWDMNRDKGTETERVFALILRSIVAAVHNAIHHTKAIPEGVVSCSVHRHPDGILISVRNPLVSGQTRSTAVGLDGTKGVILSCLRLLDKDTIYPKCHSEDQAWVTEILLPNPAVFKGSPVTWIDTRANS